MASISTAWCLAASQTTLHSSHPLQTSVITLATMFLVSRRMQSASGQYIMQRRHPFFATHFSSVTTATLYMRRPFPRSRCRDRQFVSVLRSPFHAQVIGRLHHRQVLGEQQFLLRELLRDCLVEGRGPTRRDILLPEAILEREIQRFHADTLRDARDRPDHAHVRGQLGTRDLEG